MSTKIAKELLEKLVEKLEKGAVYEITKRVGFDAYAPVQQEQEISPLPTLKGSLNDVMSNLEFIPYPEGGYLLEIEARTNCPFKLVLTLEDHEIKSLKFKGSSTIPVQEIEIDVKKFDDRFFIETLEEEPVRKFLADEETRKLIFDLGEIDRLAFQYKYMKLVYYIEDIAKLEVNWIFDKIDKLSKICKKLEELNLGRAKSNI